MRILSGNRDRLLNELSLATFPVRRNNHQAGKGIGGPGFRNDLNAEMNWDLGCDQREWSKDCQVTVRGILERDPKAWQGSALSASGWKSVQDWCAANKCTEADRTIPIDSKSPTLIASYHRRTNVEFRDRPIRGGGGGRMNSFTK